jgi:hypothetical protein
MQEEELRDAILLVFANKQDQKGALNAAQVRVTPLRCHIHIFLFSVGQHMMDPLAITVQTSTGQTHDGAFSPRMWCQISESLGLSNLRQRQWTIQETSATKGKGLFEGFDWCVDGSFSIIHMRDSRLVYHIISYHIIYICLFHFIDMRGFDLCVTKAHYHNRRGVHVIYIFTHKERVEIERVAE